MPSMHIGAHLSVSLLIMQVEDSSSEAAETTATYVYQEDLA